MILLIVPCESLPWKADVVGIVPNERSSMTIRFETFSRASAVDSVLWNSMAEHASPLMEWEYFTALEESQSAGPDRGYYPSHILAHWNGEPAALAPLYERDRSWVEFGDGGLIQFLSELTCIPYQHGLVGTLPFTPVPDYQFLYGQGVDTVKITRLLLEYIDYVCETRSLYTSRLYFYSPRLPQVHSVLRSQGYLTFKTNYCFWLNRGFQNFNDYLMTFKSGRRTKIKREIRAVRDMGIRMTMVPGTEAGPRLFQMIQELYLRTWHKHMGTDIPPFLKNGFFERLQNEFRHRISICLATLKGESKAAALFYHKNKTLYGRYWGCFEEIPFLHFVLCYYYPIDYAIANGYTSMDPGFGGEHKLIRGFELTPVFHYIKFHGVKERQIARSILGKLHLNPMAFS